MTLRRKDPLFCLLIAIFVAATAWAFSISAHAAGPAESAVKKKKASPAAEYVVKSGDTLGGIALANGTTLEKLLDVNSIENPDRLSEGQKLVLPRASKHGRVTKRGVVIRIPKGFSLSRIAAAYEISSKALIRANSIKNPDHIRAGQKLFIPEATKIIELVPPPPCFKDPVTVYRVRSDETKQLSLCFCNGRPNPDAIAKLSSISGPRGKEVPFPLHPHLAQLLQSIADEYPGKRIEIISGQRVRKQPGHESYHNKGRALDFRVAGVPNKKLVSFVRKFKNVGVGYYPNSVFIHMDTRESRAYWIDYSGPGEKAIYGRAGMSKQAVERIRAERREKHAASIEEKVTAKVTKLIESLKKDTSS
ncbi:MAG: LysM peptidoglycan-binding domain-containing protein [Deltaproteobacteria bacterium]|nr:LysM peptidoglycan-binding domain-containing protein [Deltaproteobacteria bacterium]